MIDQLKKRVAEVEMVSLRARLKAAQGFVCNTDMHVECSLLRAQIHALENLVDPVEKTRCFND